MIRAHLRPALLTLISLLALWGCGGGGAVDDATRGGGRLLKDAPPYQVDPPPSRTLPPVPQTGASTEEAVRAGESDDIAKDVICFAHNNFSVDEATGSLTVSSEDEFVEAVVMAFASNLQSGYRAQAEDLYETLTDPDTSVSEAAVALGCT